MWRDLRLTALAESLKKFLATSAEEKFCTHRSSWMVPSSTGDLGIFAKMALTRSVLSESCMSRKNHMTDII